MLTTILIATGVLVLVVVGYLLLALRIASRVLKPERRPLAPVHVSPDQAFIELPASPFTATPGCYSLEFDHEERHAVIGEIVETNEKAKTVIRAVLHTDGRDLLLAREGRYTGQVFANPESVQPDFKEVQLRTETGTCPAWLFPSESQSNSSVWAIHIHGALTTRSTTLRSVHTASQLGYTSLVPSYRGDGEGPTVAGSVSALGQEEWRDVESALEYALDNGAKNIVLFGWSMGAMIALLASEQSAYRACIRGLVLISPVTNWKATVSAGIRAARLPRVFAVTAIEMLRNPVSSRLLGLTMPIDFEKLDWSTGARPLNTPTLVIHSDGDTTVPLQSSIDFAMSHPSMAELAIFPDAPHAFEWNRSRRLFESTVHNWCKTIGL